MPVLTQLRERLNEIRYTNCLVYCLVVQKWQLLFIQQIFIEQLQWTSHRVLRMQQSKAPVLLLPRSEEGGWSRYEMGGTFQVEGATGAHSVLCPTLSYEKFQSYQKS